MSQKQLRFLSDSTLCGILHDPNTTEISLDGPILKRYAEEEQNKNRLRIIRHWVYLFIPSGSIATLLFYLFLNGIISEETIGLISFFCFVGILAVHYSFKPEEKKKYSEYHEAFLSIIKKERVIEDSSSEEVFNALMLRVHIIIHDETVKNKLNRLEKIITKINEYEDSENKIFRIPIKLATNIGEIRHLFRGGAIPQWAQQFTQRHSMQNSFAHETVEETEEILA